jgi:hypothetical protein
MNLTTTDADRSFISIQQSAQPIFSLTDPRIGSLHLNNDSENRGNFKTIYFFNKYFKAKRIKFIVKI